ncbi:hypothetical protein [Sutcliffiella halmapala]|uniref:hypothetical protein n=1 Tax=Sutcliffiella halmapala TaxID=79882 RepID=UPI0009955EBC|nr:hypothetical protein [Sutcliffiella halmapala]
MLIVSILLLAIAIGLIALSFFVGDKYSELKEEVEQLSFDVVQDKYKLERKIKVLEEELLIGATPIPNKKPKEKTNAHQDVSQEDVTISLFKKGYTASQISQFTSTSIEKVESVLQSAKLKGNPVNEN